MRQYLFMILLVLAELSAQAQEPITSSYDPDFDYGISSSIGVKFEKLNGNFDYRPVFEAGGYISIVSGDNWRFGAEINYTMVGFNASQSTYVNSSTPYYRYAYIDRLHILSLPIGMYRNLGHKTSIGIGYAYNQIIGYRKIVEEWNESPVEQPGLDIRKLDLAFYTDVRYALSSNVGLKFRYRHGIVSVVHNADNRFNRWVSLGLTYSLAN